jgi:uncharacterized protein HemY
MRKFAYLIIILALFSASTAYADWEEWEKQITTAGKLLVQKNHKDARKLLEKIPGNAEQYASAQELLARISIIEKKWDEAMTHMRNCLKAVPYEKMEPARASATYYRYLVQIGNQYKSKKEADQAYLAFILARALNPKGARAGKMWHEFTNNWLTNKEFDRLIKLNEEALTLVPNHPSLLWPVGLAKRGKGDHEGALAVFLQAAQRDPEAYLQAAQSYAQLNRQQEAIDLLLRALKTPEVIKERYYYRSIQVELLKLGYKPPKKEE